LDETIRFFQVGYDRNVCLKVVADVNIQIRQKTFEQVLRGKR